MIRYALRCENGHDFDGWFRSSEGFEKLQAAGQVSCTECGSAKVSKSLMAPSVPAEKARLAAPRDPKESAIEKLREHVEKNSDYVGMRFVEEARAMHEGARPNRAIYGEARPEEARKLLEDGVPVAPLPFIPKQKAN